MKSEIYSYFCNCFRGNDMQMVESDGYRILRIKNVDINRLHIRGAYVRRTKPIIIIVHIDDTLIHSFSAEQ